MTGRDGRPMAGRGGHRRWPRWAFHRDRDRGRRPLAVLDVLLGCLVGVCLLTDARLDRIDAIPRYPLKPLWGLGQDWMLVGRDDACGAGGEQRDARVAAGARGCGADTITLLHLPHDGGRPIAVSLSPRAAVLIPGLPPATLGAAFARGGPDLLVRTFEKATQIGVEHYLEVGLRDLAAMVEAAGDVRACPTRSAPATAPACRTLTGRQVLDYLRAGPAGDPDRSARQLRLAAALIAKATSLETALHPTRGPSLGTTAFHAVTVDRSTHLHDLVRLTLALRDHALVMATVPIVKTAPLPGVGSVMTWDSGTLRRLAGALVTDGPLPSGIAL
jgi:anionic cell wall polymer biosynthesis LytR-Cps2A-Psr (LCP) family protein